MDYLWNPEKQLSWVKELPANSLDFLQSYTDPRALASDMTQHFNGLHMNQRATRSLDDPKNRGQIAQVFFVFLVQLQNVLKTLPIKAQTTFNQTVIDNNATALKTINALIRDAHHNNEFKLPPMSYDQAQDYWLENVKTIVVFPFGYNATHQPKAFQKAYSAADDFLPNAKNQQDVLWRMQILLALLSDRRAVQTIQQHDKKTIQPHLQLIQLLMSVNHFDPTKPHPLQHALPNQSFPRLSDLSLDNAFDTLCGFLHNAAIFLVNYKENRPFRVSDAPIKVPQNDHDWQQRILGGQIAAFTYAEILFQDAPDSNVHSAAHFYPHKQRLLWPTNDGEFVRNVTNLFNLAVWQQAPDNAWQLTSVLRQRWKYVLTTHNPKIPHACQLPAALDAEMAQFKHSLASIYQSHLKELDTEIDNLKLAYKIFPTFVTRPAAESFLEQYGLTTSAPAIVIQKNTFEYLYLFAKSLFNETTRGLEIAGDGVDDDSLLAQLVKNNNVRSDVTPIKWNHTVVPNLQPLLNIVVTTKTQGIHLEFWEQLFPQLQIANHHGAGLILDALSQHKVEDIAQEATQSRLGQLRYAWLKHQTSAEVQNSKPSVVKKSTLGRSSRI